MFGLGFPPFLLLILDVLQAFYRCMIGLWDCFIPDILLHYNISIAIHILLLQQYFCRLRFLCPQEVFWMIRMFAKKDFCAKSMCPSKGVCQGIRTGHKTEFAPPKLQNTLKMCFRSSLI